MGLVTLHLVIGMGVFILPLFLLLFSLVAMSLAHLYIVIGSVSFVSSVITFIVLVTKFVNQPEAHGFFSYSDTAASALMSMGLLLDGILYLLPDYDTPCYQYKVVYGLFIVPIITSFFSILGMSIERFQTFALYRDRRKFTKKFSIAWFLASWTLALCFLVILLAQINEKEVASISAKRISQKQSVKKGLIFEKSFYVDILDMDLFPGPHSERKFGQSFAKANEKIYVEEDVDRNVTLALNDADLPAPLNNQNSTFNSSIAVECVFRYKRGTSDTDLFKVVKYPEPCDPDQIREILNSSNTFVVEKYKGPFGTEKGKNETKGIQCQISSRPFIMYYMILLFLLCFVTPVLVTASLNVFIQSAVSHTTYEVISNHQWLTLGACVLMWGPTLVERLLAMWDIWTPPLVVSVFLFLLGHTHNLLRSILHAVFAQQIHSVTWQGNQLNMSGNRLNFSWKIENKVRPKKRTKDNSTIENRGQNDELSYVGEERDPRSNGPENNTELELYEISRA